MIAAAPGGELWVPVGPGLPRGLTIGGSELREQFSRSSGPGGQSVNTTDSRVELRWNPGSSSSLSEVQMARVLERLGDRLVDGDVVIVASEQRSQYQNRAAARERLVALLRSALAPPPAPRRASRPSRAARQRRLDAKKQRGQTKQGRGRVRDF